MRYGNSTQNGDSFSEDKYHQRHTCVIPMLSHARQSTRHDGIAGIKILWRNEIGEIGSISLNKICNQRGDKHDANYDFPLL